MVIYDDNGLYGIFKECYNVLSISEGDALSMKVLMLTPDYPPYSFGGIAGYVHNLSQNLTQFGVEVHIVVMRCDYFISDTCQYERDGNVYLYRFESRLNRNEGNFVSRWLNNSLTILPKVNEIITAHKFDIIHNNDVFTVFLLDDIRDKLNIPIVNTVHGLSAPKTSLEDGGRRYGYYSSHGVITVSHSMEKRLVERYGVVERLRVIHLGAPDVSYPLTKSKRISFAGRLVDEKGADVLIKAIGILKDDGLLNKYEVDIIGDGDQRTYLQELVRGMNLEDCVKLHGYLPNDKAKKYIENASIHVVPSKFDEPFGISATEGMALGALTIVSNRGGLVEFIEHRKNGLIFESGNEKNLANCISEAILDSELYVSCVKNAYEFTRSHTWDRVAKKTLDFYETIKNQIS